MPTWVTQSFAFGSLLTSTKMENQYANIDFLRQALYNTTITGVDSMDLTQVVVLNNVPTTNFTGNANLGGNDLNTQNGNVNLGTGGLFGTNIVSWPTPKIAQGITTNSNGAGQLIDNTGGYPNFVTTSVSLVRQTSSGFLNFLFQVASSVGSGSLLLRESTLDVFGGTITNATSYALYGLPAKTILIEDRTMTGTNSFVLPIIQPSSIGLKYRILRIDVTSSLGGGTYGQVYFGDVTNFNVFDSGGGNNTFYLFATDTTTLNLNVSSGANVKLYSEVAYDLVTS